jgi:cysteine-rich repeat protein
MVGCDGAVMVDAGDPGTDAGQAFDCTGMADGTSCGDGNICVSGTCGESTCGDEYVDMTAGEECEDGNNVAFDGCDPGTCTFTCLDDTTCTDGDPCNGNERCEDHVCVAGTMLDEGTACATATDTGTCRDGSCVEPGCGNEHIDPGEECDDANELDGDGCDSDCQFSCDESELCENNNVCDGLSVCQLATHTCSPGTPLDCGDTDPCTADLCDAVLGCSHPLAVDADMDGFGVGECGGDCNDADDSVYPGAPELCDGMDQDCDPLTGDGTPPTWYADCDDDGFAVVGAMEMTTCFEPAPTACGGGWTVRAPVMLDIDCNDNDAMVRPRLPEVPGDPADRDENCDGIVMCFPDVDGDMVRTDTPIGSMDADCGDEGEARADAPSGDCNDNEAKAYPGATEIASDTLDLDENCDGMVTCREDRDGDGYGTGTGMSSVDGDCQDPGEARFPTTDFCPDLASVDQSDSDMDGRGDACDACPDTANAGMPCPTIYDLKSGRVTAVPFPMIGPRFTFTSLVVTAVQRQGVFVQVPLEHPNYAGAEFSGIYAFTSVMPMYSDGMPVAIGDNIDVTGQFVAFQGQLELTSAVVTRASTSYAVPAPVVAEPGEITFGGARALSLEGVLVRIDDVIVSAVMAPFRFTVDGVLAVDSFIYTFPLPAVGTRYWQITGIPVFRASAQRLNPRTMSDLEL